MRVGETVVPGVQNSAASTIMTIADMSVITAEVKVDETDIVNVKLDQAAEVTIDAMPNQTFHGHVTEIGDTAILRSTGVAASQSNTSDQEAKDFKVVIALGRSAGGHPAGSVLHRQNYHGDQAARAYDSDSGPDGAAARRSRSARSMTAVQAASKVDPAAEKAKKEELQGVFMIRDGKAEFVPVTTGITGATDIEVLSGLEGRRSDHHRHLQDHPDAAQFRQGQGQQQSVRPRRRKASAWRQQHRTSSIAARA